MQPRSCDDVAFLISKYVDGEATQEEREVVDSHVPACPACARKLTEYMEFAAIFAEAPMHAPQPELRAGLFREIGAIKEGARQRESQAQRKRSWKRFAPNATSSRQPRGRAWSWGAVWDVASPFAALGLAVCALVAFVVVNGGKAPSASGSPTAVAQVVYPSVPTIPATVVYQPAITGDTNLPSAPSTRLASAEAVASASVIVAVHATEPATAGDSTMLQLQQSTPVMEDSKSWHALVDETYGYSISYPYSWWTETMSNTRLFFPWSQGGTRYAPYWIAVTVQPNARRLDTASANMAMFGGKCKVATAGQVTPTGQCRITDPWVEYNGGDSKNSTEDVYGFDASYIYHFTLTVPKQSSLDDFNTRWDAAQAVFPKMLSRVSFGTSANRLLFLNGGDLWSVSASGSYSNPEAVWKGYNRTYVKQFAPSSNGSLVAFTTTSDNDNAHPFGQNIFVTDLSAASSNAATPLMQNAEIHDIAWYSDQALLAIAKFPTGLGLYKITVGSSSPPQLLLPLGDDMAGAKGLSVSPDRQLISFLAPLGAGSGTDVYAVRPDGSDLVKLVSHSNGVPIPSPDGSLVSADKQAVKSYIWTDGRLEPGLGGYEFNLLYTCGDAISPTQYRGGYLYDAPTGPAPSAPVLDPAALRLSDAAGIQIVQIAYSPVEGKVAFSGFYNNKDTGTESLGGLWVADFSNGVISNVAALPGPTASHGLSDLQWSPDGKSLIYRDIVFDSEVSSAFASRYDGHSPFTLYKLDITTSQKTLLYDSGR